MHIINPNKLLLASLIVAIPMSEALAQQEWESTCRPGLMGNLECTHTQQNQQRIQLSPVPDINQNAVFNDNSLMQMQNSILQNTINNIEQHSAEQAAAQQKQEELMLEVRRAMYNDPDNAELIAQMYGVGITPETQRYIEALRAKKQAQ